MPILDGTPSDLKQLVQKDVLDIVSIVIYMYTCVKSDKLFNMKLLKAFAYVLKRSLTNPAYYPEILKTDFRFSLKYFMTVAVLATVVVTARTTIPLIPEVQEVIYESLEQTLTIYPEDLVISAEDGDWAVNQTEPYAIKTPEFLENSSEESYQTQTGDIPSNLMVFDHNGTLNDLEKYDTFVLVNAANAIVLNERGTVEVYPLDNLPEGEITQETYAGWLDTFREWLKFLPAVIVLFVLAAAFFYYTGFRMLYLLAYALILKIVGGSLKLTLSYRDYYRIGMHSMTLPVAIELLLILLVVEFGFPFWFLLVNLAFGYVVLRRMAGGGESEVKEAPKA